MTLKVGIAGYGVVGKRRRLFIDAHKALKTVAVCDQNFAEDGQMDDGVAVIVHLNTLIPI